MIGWEYASGCHKVMQHGRATTRHREHEGGTRRKRGDWEEKTKQKEGGVRDRMKHMQRKEQYRQYLQMQIQMDVDISNVGSMNINFVKYQSRGTFGQVSELRGAQRQTDC